MLLTLITWLKQYLNLLFFFVMNLLFSSCQLTLLFGRYFEAVLISYFCLNFCLILASINICLWQLLLWWCSGDLFPSFLLHLTAIFCNKELSFLPHLFTHSIISWYKHGLKDTYFVLLIIARYYYLVFQVVPNLATGSSITGWLLCPFYMLRSFLLEHFLLCGTTRYSRLSLYILCPSSGNQSLL